jgi:hypothetical protein
MKLTLTLDRAPFGVRAALVEEWDEIGGHMTMAPIIRLFASGEQAIAWGRLRAHRRGLREIYLSDNRGAGQSRAPGRVRYRPAREPAAQ